MARKPASVEFIQKLKKLSGHAQTKSFANACGKKAQVANITNYLKGKTAPGDKVLKDCLNALFGWRVHVSAEVAPLPKPLTKITTKPGLYCFYDITYRLTYVGKAANLKTEINQTLNRSVPGLVKKKHKDITRYYSAYIVEEGVVRANLEALLIRICGHHTYNDNVPELSTH